MAGNSFSKSLKKSNSSIQLTEGSELTVGSQEGVSFDVKLSLKTIAGNSVSIDLRTLPTYLQALEWKKTGSRYGVSVEVDTAYRAVCLECGQRLAIFTYVDSEEFVNVFMRIGFGSTIELVSLDEGQVVTLIANSLAVSRIVIAKPGVRATTRSRPPWVPYPLGKDFQEYQERDGSV
ncbi:hypothetical protein Tco_1370151 [Tanacetum coccineum]